MFVCSRIVQRFPVPGNQSARTVYFSANWHLETESYSAGHERATIVAHKTPRGKSFEKLVEKRESQIAKRESAQARASTPPVSKGSEAVKTIAGTG